jgi:hypothetical protein
MLCVNGYIASNNGVIMATKITEIIAADSAMQKSFTPKTESGPKAEAVSIMSLKSSHQPKAVPIETKSIAQPPPAKDK